MSQFYEVKTFIDNHGREVAEVIGSSEPIDLEGDAQHSERNVSVFAAIIAVTQKVGQLPIQTPNGIIALPIVAIEKLRMPIPEAKTLQEAFDKYDAFVDEIKKLSEESRKQPKLVGATPMQTKLLVP